MHPIIKTKFPDINFETLNGSTSLSKFTSNKKPTVLVLFSSQEDIDTSMLKKAGEAIDMFNALRGKSTGPEAPTPEMILKQIQDNYLTK